jgi:hypothetical protein
MTRALLGSRVRAIVLPLLPVVAGLLFFLVPKDAHAYAWMIRHDYGGCVQCHADPSGGGPLTEYGRAQGDLLLRMRYGAKTEEPGPTAGYLAGLVTPPEWLMPGGDFRGMGLATKANGSSLTTDFILMQADLRAAVAVGGFRAGASIGAVTSEGSAASLVGSVVSREHWAGYAFSDGEWLVRAGRINLPYGIRSVEHTLMVRSATRTDLNDTQQHGVALAYSGNKIRGEILGIAGNYQIAPDAYRQRGYSMFVEVQPVERLGVGVSSLVTHANKDLFFRAGDLRQAHGLFARYSPVRPVVLLAEGDAVLHSFDGGGSLHGYAGMLQADLEPIQGLHFIATGEVGDSGAPQSGTSWGGWAGVNWFFLPHADLRFDAMLQRMALGPMTMNVSAYMLQLHVYL